MRFATLISWLLTASLGGFMLRTWLVRGGLRRERAKVGGLPPQIVFGHAGAAVVGLLAWGAFVASGVRAFAWAGVGLLTVAISLGLCTVTLWAPYPARRPGERRRPDRWDVPATGLASGLAVQGRGAAGGTPDQSGRDQAGFEVTDEMINQFLADPAPRVYPLSLDPAVLIPVMHGFLAITTYLLAMLSAIP